MPLFYALLGPFRPGEGFFFRIKDSVLIDPACGTSGFLVSAGEYLKEKYHDAIFYNREKKEHYNNHMFYGYDLDRTMLRVGAMNMMTHGVDNPNISYRDSLSDQNLDNGRYSIILANPPFKGSLDYADLLEKKFGRRPIIFLSNGFDTRIWNDRYYPEHRVTYLCFLQTHRQAHGNISCHPYWKRGTLAL